MYELKPLPASVQSRGGIPVLVLTVPSDMEFSFTLQTDPQFEWADIPDFWKEFLTKGEDALLQAIQSYTATVLAHGMTILENLSRCEALLQFYRRLEPHLQKHTFFRLGLGKTYFFNSVGCFLSEDQLRRVFGNDRRVRLGPDLPSTTFVVSEEGNQISLGWLVVTKTQEGRR